MLRTPGGASTRSKQHQVFGGGDVPATLQMAELASVCSVNGRWLTDWVCALGAVGIGHTYHASMNGALSLPSHLEEQVAGELLAVLPKQPGWDQVRWVTTGSECTAAAMQVARMQTHRKEIVSVGYHGWHEAHLASKDLLALPIDSPRVFEHITGDTAAVIVEPMRDHMEYTPLPYTRQEYLESIHEACRLVGALFIVDEIVTGFRYALGGATERFNLKPDLACYGKAMSNGYPIAALVGNHRIMRHAVEVSGTYNGWPPALEMVSRTIQAYIKYDVVGHMRRMGERLQAGAQGLLRGWPCHPVFTDKVEDRIALVQKAARGGHLLHPAGFNIMHAHSEKDVDSLIQVLTS